MKRKKNIRLTRDEIEIIKNMTLQGKSLRNISSETGIGLTTIYYQVRKFKPKERKEFIINLSNEKIGELVGAFAGDGSYYKGNTGHHKVKYTLSLKDDYNYGVYIGSLLKKLNLNPFLFKREKYNSIDVTINSLSFINLIKQYVDWKEKKGHSIELKENIGKYSKDFLIGFARGLMDTDGYVEVSNVSCASISEKLIKNLMEIFDIFNIEYKYSIKERKNRKDLFLVRVHRKSLEKYKKVIGFNNEYKLVKLNKILNK
jgi:hypothetical protein